jgi:hypothetical protein
VEYFIYFGTTITNENCVYEEIKSIIRSRNACYRVMQNHFSSGLVTKTLKIKNERETWCLTLREEHWLKVFENTALRKLFGPKRDEVTGEW